MIRHILCWLGFHHFVKARTFLNDNLISEKEYCSSCLKIKGGDVIEIKFPPRQHGETDKNYRKRVLIKMKEHNKKYKIPMRIKFEE